MLITIGGFFGSGGDELGRELSKRLNYQTYDNELMEKAVAESEMDMRRSTLEFYDEKDENILSSGDASFHKALLSLEMDVLPIGHDDPEPTVTHYQSDLLSLFMDSAPIKHYTKVAPVSRKDEVERLRFAQAKVVLDAAEKGNAVFFGRCSSYILGRRPDTLRIFTYASLESCRARVKQYYSIESDTKADELIQKTNMRRGIYYETFTEQKWDDLKNYDLCINTDALPFEAAVDAVLHALSLLQA